MYVTWSLLLWAHRISQVKQDWARLWLHGICCSTGDIPCSASVTSVSCHNALWEPGTFPMRSQLFVIILGMSTLQKKARGSEPESRSTDSARAAWLNIARVPSWAGEEGGSQSRSRNIYMALFSPIARALWAQVSWPGCWDLLLCGFFLQCRRTLKILWHLFQGFESYP